jgi:hypothetical protein
LAFDDDDDENSSMDPFNVQERVFSKYAAMIYTSDNNGRTFHEFKDSKYCPSCGEKVNISWSLYFHYRLLSQITTPIK